MKRYGIQTLRLAVLMLLLAGASCPQRGKIPALAEILTAENAQRALVMTQDARVAARDALAKTINADGVTTPEEYAAAQRFDRYDKEFTSAWATANSAAKTWKTVGGTMPQSFAAAYQMLLDLLANRLTVGGSNG